MPKNHPNLGKKNAQQKRMPCLQLLLPGRGSGRLLLPSLEGDTSKHHSCNEGDPGTDLKVLRNPPEEGCSSQIPEEFHWGTGASVTAGKAGREKRLKAKVKSPTWFPFLKRIHCKVQENPGWQHILTR